MVPRAEAKGEVNLNFGSIFNTKGDEWGRPVEPIIQFRPSIETVQAYIKANFENLGANKLAWAMRIPYCESGYNPYSRNKKSAATGLYQFMPRTFYANARRLGLEKADIWNWRHQVVVAKWMIAHDQEGQWECR